MTSGALPLAIICGIVALGSALGFFGGRWRQLNLEEWTVAGRKFGLLLVLLLTAGELFTVFSLLGLSGWIYSRGAPTLYILAYVTLAQVVGFFLLPIIWELGRTHGLQTQPDFFVHRYGSKALGAFVALAGIFFLILYLQLQLTGLGIIVETASFDRIGRTPAMLASAALISAFVFTSGVRGVAWVSVLKDILLVAAVSAVGLCLPYIHFGGIGPMFAAIARAKPHHFVMPGETKNLGHSWYITTVLLSSLSFTWPHIFGSAFTAKSGDTLRWNAVIMPFYVIPLVLIIFVGCAAILLVPHLANSDMALLMVVRQAFPPWVLGVIGGAGALTAMVPAAIQIVTASTLLAKNVCQPAMSRPLTDRRLGLLARFAVVGIMAVALALALTSSESLVGLLLVAYAGVGQFFPGIVLGLFSKRATGTGIFAGMAAGLALAAALILNHRDPFHGVSAGLVAVAVNFVIAAGVSAWAPARAEPQAA